MIRLLIGLPVLLILLAAGALYYAYGEVDPCRVLAVEHARRTENETGLHIHRLVEPWTRLETSQLSTGQCVRELIDSWHDRLNEKTQEDTDTNGSSDSE